MWTKERLRMLKHNQRPVVREDLCVTAKDLDELERLQFETGLRHDPLRDAWLSRPPKKELTYDHNTGGSLYAGKVYKSMGLDKFYRFMYEECVWRRRRDGQPYPTFEEWVA